MGDGNAFAAVAVILTIIVVGLIVIGALQWYGQPIYIFENGSGSSQLGPGGEQHLLGPGGERRYY